MGEANTSLTGPAILPKILFLFLPARGIYRENN